MRLPFDNYPNYLPFVKGNEDMDNASCATTACGGVVSNNGKVTVAASVKDRRGETMDFPIPFNNMEVQIPILSLRNTMKRGHTARLNQRGGYIKNLMNGQRAPVYEREGVYYLKVKIRAPPPLPDVSSSEVGFARPGR